MSTMKRPLRIDVPLWTAWHAFESVALAYDRAMFSYPYCRNYEQESSERS